MRAASLLGARQTAFCKNNFPEVLSIDATVIAFTSGKGGTGKSTTSVYTAGALAMLGKKVLLVELDSGLRSVDIIAGVSSEAVFDTEDVFLGRVDPEKAMIKSPAYPGLTIMPAPYQGGVITKDHLKGLYTRVRPHFDYMVLDVAAGMGESFAAAVDIAHRVILVLTADPVCLRDGRLVADEIWSPKKQLNLVLNRIDGDRVITDGLLRDLDEAIDIVGAQLLGVVPESPAIQKAGAGGGMLPKLSREQSVYNAIAKRITGADVPLVYG